jgi:hypothetical protein
MQLRYMGFDQANGIREYRFDGTAAGEVTKHFVVSADMGLFVKHCIGVQEGPALSLQKLAADLETPQPLPHQLTNDDLLVYVSARTAAAERKAATRRWEHPQKPVPPPPGN